MKKYLLILVCLLSLNYFTSAQTLDLKPAKGLTDLINRLENDKTISANDALAQLKAWNTYPQVNKTGTDYTWYYDDPTFGRIPMKVFIPASYRSDKPSPCIMLLHGALGIAHWNQVDSVAKWDDLETFPYLKKQNYIIIRPIGDKAKKFNWVVNDFRPGINLTFRALSNFLTALKQILNIDDERLFAFGHSDGSDGTVGLGVYTPDAFAGFVVYNSMMTNLFTSDFYIHNIVNRPFFVVHSDLDDLRPMQITNDIIKTLRNTGDSGIIYKEYYGYQHQDKHLLMDSSRALKFLSGVARNGRRDSLYWETNGTTYATCDWIRLIDIQPKDNSQDWAKALNVKSYNKFTKQYYPDSKYYDNAKSAAVKAHYHANHFDLLTTGVKEIELKIDSRMVDMSKPVIVTINGKQVYSTRIMANKTYLLNNFRSTYDRQALWVNAIDLKID